MADGMYGMRDWPSAWSEGPADKLIPVVPSPKDILVLVAGGTGKLLRSKIRTRTCFSSRFATWRVRVA